MMNILRSLLLGSLGLALVRGDCGQGDDVEWGGYGYFQTCRSHHIKQALQVKSVMLCQMSNRLCVQDYDLPIHLDVITVKLFQQDYIYVYRCIPRFYCGFYETLK